MKTFTTSEKDPEIEKLKEERKQLRVKENKTTEEKIKYTELKINSKEEKKSKSKKKEKRVCFKDN